MASAGCATSVSHRQTCGRRVLTGLLELEADDTTSELAVDVQGLFSGDWVPTDDRVDVLHRLAANDTSTTARTGELGLLEAGVGRLQRPEEGDELGRETLERRHLRGEEGVASRGGLGEQEERREARRLELVGDIRVPDGRADPVLALKVVGRVPVAVHEVQLGHAVGVPGRRVDVQAPEVAAPRAEPLHGAVKELLLVPEDHHSSPGDL